MRLRPEEAVALFAGAFVLFASASSFLPMNTAGLVAAQIVCFALPAIVVLRWRGIPLRSGLGLNTPRPSGFAGAALIGVSFWYIALWITVLILGDRVTDPERLAELEQQISWTNDSAAVRLLAVAIVPAISEELLLRGVIARSLRPSFGLFGAVFLSALLFAALHLPPVRMLPVGVFGLVLGYAAVVTDSVYPAMLMHFLNNLVVAVVIPGVPELGEAMDAYPVVTGVAAVALTASGAALLWRSRVCAPQ